MDKAFPRDDWKNSTTVILAGGPSLTQDDVRTANSCRWVKENIKIIGVNESWKLAWCNLIYGADPCWWKERGSLIINFQRWTQDKNWQHGEAEQMGIKQIQSKPGAYISFDPSFIYQGANSSFQAMNLAILFGSKRIVFLGLDLMTDGDKTHWHEYPEKFKRRCPGYPTFKKSFEDVAQTLQDNDIEVINASRRTALTCFKQMTIEEALK